MSVMTLELLAERRRNEENRPTVFELDGETLKPCPFCKSPEITVGSEDWGGQNVFWCECMACGGCGPEKLGRRFAILEWQKR